jgi:osmotically-inducible protein OsmY
VEDEMTRLLKNDVEIQRDVIEELKWDTHVSAADVGVAVHNGVVTLTGRLASWAARAAAQDAAHCVAGVLDVANDIQVAIPGSRTRTDTELATAVRAALEWDVLVPHDKIHTTISDGVVTLEGTVASWTEHDDAARCLRYLTGVRGITNKLQVVPPSVSAGDVKRSIEQALTRHANHAARHVSILVADGTVTLSGDVPSYAELRAIEGAARGAKGVRKVDSRLRIHM